MARSKASVPARAVPARPSARNWDSDDAAEIERRRERAQEETFSIANLEPARSVFSRFEVRSGGSGRTYQVEIRDIAQRQFACECVDFRTNGLGTCKHVEAVLRQLEARWKKRFHEEAARGPQEPVVVLDHAHDRLRLHGPAQQAPRWMRLWLAGEAQEDPEEFVRKASADRGVRLSIEIVPWIEKRRRAVESLRLRREYERKVQAGEWPAQETTVPLFPYQREGMLHLAFKERALLADEMGLGKTIQAIAACALLHRLGQAQRILVVTPASLKAEWEEQIQRFTPLPCRLVFGGRVERLRCYTEDAPFFTIANYEQIVADALDVNARLLPDVVILDEAQRIKNWGTKTSQAIKRLRSRYAFVLTGTPIENRIDELHSLMDFLEPAILGPLFRFNREFYQLDERGRPIGYRQLDVLHERIRPRLLRRRKAEVETELPERVDRNHFVAMAPLQRSAYDGHEAIVSRLASVAQRRPLTPQEMDKLMRELAMMRMICDTNYILDEEDRECPKLAELRSVLEEIQKQDGVKVIIFSEWERMLLLVRELCDELGLEWAWHTGTVPQARRRVEINRFKQAAGCRVFLSTDAGATGLNLQVASVVINCDLPWNPAKLEQRIARAWRKHQSRSVQVINLVTENSIEHRMLATLADKKAVADGVLDRVGDLKEIKLRGGRQAMIERLQQVLAPAAVKPAAAARAEPLPVDRAQAFAAAAASMLRSALVSCEEIYPRDGTHSVIQVVVNGQAADWQPRLRSLHERFFARADPLLPVHLQVLDRTTHAALRQLQDCGLIAPTTRGSRPLLGVDAGAPPELTPEAQARVVELSRQIEHQLKIVRALGAADLRAELRPALLEAARLHAARVAVRGSWPEPVEIASVGRPPLAQALGRVAGLIAEFLETEDADWQPLAEALSA